MKNELSTKDLEVYAIIERQSSEGKWVSMAELSFLTDINERAVRQCITNIREYEDNDKIIIGCSKGYKILSNEEEFTFLLSRKKRILNALNRYYKDVRRFNRNNNYAIKNPNAETLEIVNAFK